MEKEMNRLIDECVRFADACRSGKATEEIINEYTYRIINAAAEIYKREDIRLLIPCYDSGDPAVYQEADRNYIPVCTSTDTLKKAGCSKHIDTSLKELCSYVYENISNYQFLFDPQTALNNGVSYSDLVDYAKNNIKFEGFMLDPGSDHIFGFDGWIFQALMFKGMGVSSFDVIDADTGEKKYEV